MGPRIKAISEKPATRNADLPVLVDAEQIHSCRYDDDEVEIYMVSIDSPAVQEYIVGMSKVVQRPMRRYVIIL